MKPEENSFFTDDFPTVKNQDELQKEQEQYNQYDKYYVTCGCMPEKWKMIEDLWKTYQPYADEHFFDQYKKENYHQRTWEMYMGCVLLEKGFLIKTNSEGPDFVVNDSYYIECVACNNAKLEKIDRVPDEVITYDKQPINSGFSDVSFGEHPERQMILRFTNNISDKLSKYKNWANKPWFDKNKPYIIALNSGIFPYIQDKFDLPIIINALFGLEYPRINLETNQLDYSWRESVQKGSSLVPVNGFTNESMKEISAILFSSKDAINHPSNIGDDCCLINNPFTQNPINMDSFKTFERWYADKEGEITRLEEK